MAGILNHNETTFADILHKGMLDSVRKNLKTRLMNSLEKDVDQAIDDVLSGMKGYVESHNDWQRGEIVFNVMIDGVKKNVA
jgi:hypothetical protein